MKKFLTVTASLFFVLTWSSSVFSKTGSNVDSGNKARGSFKNVAPERSLLWARYHNFTPCQTWFAAWKGKYGNEGYQTMSPVSNTSQCPENWSNIQRPKNCRYKDPKTGECPTYHFQSMNWQPWRLNPDWANKRKPGFSFYYGNMRGGHREIILKQRSNYMGKQTCDHRETALTIYDDNSSGFIRKKNGEKYKIGDFENLILSFEAKATVLTEPEKYCKVKKNKFKPSLLIDYYDENGKRIHQNAIVAYAFDKHPQKGIYRKNPEIVAHRCSHPWFKDAISACTVWVNNDFWDNHATLKDGYQRFSVDLIKKINHYYKYRLFKHPKGMNLSDAEFRALQFVQVTMGAEQVVKINNINLKGDLKRRRNNF
jgi:hypothetical protein